jgi:hypothetical protein
VSGGGGRGGEERGEIRGDVQASEQEHEADCYLLGVSHLQFQHVGDGDGEDADVAEEVDDADAEVELLRFRISTCLTCTYIHTVATMVGYSGKVKEAYFQQGKKKKYKKYDEK